MNMQTHPFRHFGISELVKARGSTGNQSSQSKSKQNKGKKIEERTVAMNKVPNRLQKKEVLIYRYLLCFS